MQIAETRNQRGQGIERESVTLCGVQATDGKGNARIRWQAKGAANFHAVPVALGPYRFNGMEINSTGQGANLPRRHSHREELARHAGEETINQAVKLAIYQRQPADMGIAHLREQAAHRMHQRLVEERLDAKAQEHAEKSVYMNNIWLEAT